mgnify:CR=1 FL=1
MKQNIYEVQKNVEKILKGNYTGFLPINMVKEVQAKLKRRDYQVLSPYNEAEKIILFGKRCPKIRLYRILVYESDKIWHSSILGSLFGLNITSEMFGDIVLYEGNFYFYVLDDIHEYVVNNFLLVGNVRVKLEEVDANYLENYERMYEVHELIVASERIDAIVARLIGCNREKVQDKIRERLVMLNGEVLSKASYILKEGDVFSIRGFGKYVYWGIRNRTKRDNYVIEIKKYI